MLLAELDAVRTPLLESDVEYGFAARAHPVHHHEGIKISLHDAEGYGRVGERRNKETCGYDGKLHNPLLR